MEKNSPASTRMHPRHGRSIRVSIRQNIRRRTRAWPCSQAWPVSAPACKLPLTAARAMCLQTSGHVCKSFPTPPLRRKCGGDVFCSSTRRSRHAKQSSKEDTSRLIMHCVVPTQSPTAVLPSRAQCGGDWLFLLARLRSPSLRNARQSRRRLRHVEARAHITGNSPAETFHTGSSLA